VIFVKRETFFLKFVIVLMGLFVFALCIFGLPWLANNQINPDYKHILYPILIGLYLSAIPFYIALYDSFRILVYIDKNSAFSDLSVRALQHIKYCAITVSTMYVLMMPFVYLLADKDDAPGFIIIAMVPTFASIVIAAFAGVLQKL